MRKRSLQRRAFSLVELLVVIGIVGVLIALVIPSLGRARDQARTVVCLNNLRQVGAAAINHAVANEGNLPASQQHSGTWMWDLSRQTTDQLIAAGATRETFFCPFAYDRQEFDGLWEFKPEFRVTGYFWYFKRPVSNLPALAAPKSYKVRITDATSGPDSELGSDVTLNQNGSFSTIYGGWTGGAHGTSHMRRDKPLGGNVFYMDGHAEWRPFSDMQNRTGSFNPQHWF